MTQVSFFELFFVGLPSPLFGRINFEREVRLIFYPCIEIFLRFFGKSDITSCFCWSFICVQTKTARSSCSRCNIWFSRPKMQTNHREWSYDRINVFWTLVKDFVDTWFQVILWSFVRWSCSYFVSAHIRESKTGWLIAIWWVYASDPCFLDFGEGFCGYIYLISLNFMKFCSQKLVTLCFSTY